MSLRTDEGPKESVVPEQGPAEKAKVSWSSTQAWWRKAPRANRQQDRKSPRRTSQTGPTPALATSSPFAFLTVWVMAPTAGKGSGIC